VPRFASIVHALPSAVHEFPAVSAVSAGPICAGERSTPYRLGGSAANLGPHLDIPGTRGGALAM